MQVNNITGYYSINKAKYNRNKFFQPSFGMARVDKGISRFYEFNEKRLPTTVKNFFDKLADKFAYTPLELQSKAYEKLNDNEVKNIEDVQRLFPNEELFIYLKSIKDTNAHNGLLGIYREFKDLYENGILNDGSDFTVYLLKKFFIETKTLDEVNLDLEQDLNPDIKTEYQRRNPDGQYVRPSTLKALEIYLPDIRYLNSLRFTREGYSDAFGLKISEAQYKYWNSLTEEQRFEILSRRCEGRDNWWNSLSYNEKLEYAAGIDSDDDLYSNYKSFVRTQKRKSKTENIVGEMKLTPKRIAVGSSSLKDKDIFVLWMKKNIEKFYTNLSERDKDTVHLKRVRRLTVRWNEMSPEERTQLIQKMRIERQPIRFAMIDAWNHYPELIKELSAFLKEQQIFKPVDLLYSSEEFSEFQSKIMTEFWAMHRDMAEIFGEKIRDAQARVEDALMHGQFEDLKQEILRNKAYRIKMLEHEKRAMERAKTAEAAAEEKTQIQEPAMAEAIENDKEYFVNAMQKAYDPNNLLPKSYMKEMTDFYTEIMPQEVLKESAELISEGKPSFNIMSQYINAAENTEKFDYAKKASTALGVAIANEFYSQGTSAVVYTLPLDTLVSMLQQGVEAKSFKNQINKERIARQYEEFKKNLSEEESLRLGYDYFLFTDELSDKDKKEVEKYFSSFGRTLLIAFSEKSAYPDDVKIKFFKNFMNNLPEKLKSKIKPYWQKDENIEKEKEISSIYNQLKLRLGLFLPQEIGEIYSREVARVVRIFENPYGTFNITWSKEDYESIAKGFSIENIKQRMCQRTTKTNMAPFAEIDKSAFMNDSKLRLIAIEQAMADELYRVSKDERMYQFPIETLVSFYEILLIQGKKGKNDVEIGDNIFIFKEQPRTQLLKMNYLKYYNELKEIDAKNTNGNDEYFEEILYTLNPYEDMPERDERIKARLDYYNAKFQK